MTTTSAPSQAPAAAQQSQSQLHILFIRHGETQDNIDRMLQGHRDTSLTPKGHREAQVLADKLHAQPVDAVYHSPLTRIRQTIQPILDQDHRRHLEVHSDPDLRGQFLGDLEGGSYDTVDMNNPRSADAQVATAGVELFDDFVRRLKRSFARIVGAEARQAVGQQQRGDRTVIIATHGVAITALFKTLESSPACDGFNAKMATRGPDAFEVRWTDSDDVSRLVVARPAELPVGKDGVLDWDAVVGEPFFIDYWGKREKAL